MIVVYVAGPYTAENSWKRELNVRRAEEVALEVASRGATPLCPHSMTRFFDGTVSNGYWYEATLELMRRCDAVFFLPGWEESLGSRGEMEEALRLALPVLLTLDDVEVMVRLRK